jgi:hypothetical protein
MSDALSEHYKSLFSGSCDLHDICYFAPGNTKAFCDDMLKWHTDRDCERDGVKAVCLVNSAAWREGLETPISTQYWERSQDWGRRNCRINPPPPSPVSWVALTASR